MKLDAEATTTTVAVIDAVRGHRDGLAGAVQLASHLDLAGSAATVDELPDDLVDGLDAVVVQAGGPGMDLVGEVRGARRRAPEAVVAVLCGFVDDYVVERLTESGADVVVSTHVPLDEVFDLLSRTAPCGPVDAAPDPLGRARRLARVHGITEREHLVLCLLAEGHRPQGIAHDLRLSVDTVRDHLKGLRRKLRCAGAVELVVTAHRLGVLPSLGRPLR